MKFPYSIDIRPSIASRITTGLFFLGAMIPVSPAAFASNNIIWSGSFETGDFMQWHNLDKTGPNFSQMPKYCRPPEGGGDGSCLEIVTDRVRIGNYAAKFTVKNSANGAEPDDCDIPEYSRCDRRRTELTGQATHSQYYDAMPYMSERWISISVYVPNNWDTGGNSWGPHVFQIKPRNESGLSPNVAISIEGNSWKLWHRWAREENPSSSGIS